MAIAITRKYNNAHRVPCNYGFGGATGDPLETGDVITRPVAPSEWLDKWTVLDVFQIRISTNAAYGFQTIYAQPDITDEALWLSHACDHNVIRIKEYDETFELTRDRAINPDFIIDIRPMKVAIRAFHSRNANFDIDRYKIRVLAYPEAKITYDDGKTS